MSFHWKVKTQLLLHRHEEIKQRELYKEAITDVIIPVHKGM